MGGGGTCFEGSPLCANRMYQLVMQLNELGDGRVLGDLES